MKRNMRMMALAVTLAAAGTAGIVQLCWPGTSASCAECGNGPKDKKCPEGQVCKDYKCVKK